MIAKWCLASIFSSRKTKCLIQKAFVVMNVTHKKNKNTERHPRLLVMGEESAGLQMFRIPESYQRKSVWFLCACSFINLHSAVLSQRNLGGKWRLSADPVFGVFLVSVTTLVRFKSYFSAQRIFVMFFEFSLFFKCFWNSEFDLLGDLISNRWSRSFLRPATDVQWAVI